MSLKQNNNQRCTCAFVSFDNHRASHCKLKKWSKASFLYPIAHQNKSNSPKKNNKMKVTIQENNNLTEKTSETTATEKTLITQYQNDNNNDNRSHSLQSEATLTTMETIEVYIIFYYSYFFTYIFLYVYIFYINRLITL